MRRDSFIRDLISSYATACCSIVWSLISLVSNGSRHKGGLCVEGALHRGAARCSTLHCITACLSQEVGLSSGTIRGCVLQHVALCCRLCASVVQCVAVCIVVGTVCYSVLQFDAERCSVVQSTGTQECAPDASVSSVMEFLVFQRTAANCNTLQHTTLQRSCL